MRRADLEEPDASSRTSGSVRARGGEPPRATRQRNGFVLWQKRLEKDRFPWPRSEETKILAVTGRELNWLLDGIDVFRLKPHGELSFSAVR